MPLNPNAAGVGLGNTTMSWSSRDAMIYALGVGSGTDELSFATENTYGVRQQVLPTFAVTIGQPEFDLAPLGDVDWAHLLHGRQSITLYRPIPVDGSIDVSGTVESIHDKGPGNNAIITLAYDAADPGTGAKLMTCRCTMVIRGAGGFGGKRGAANPPGPIPERPPDHRIVDPVHINQALLYRLSGDRNPLHSDPWFATEKAGFPRPILHGLCTYGFAGRALIASVCDGDVSRFAAMDARFTSPVFPGETLTTHVWESDTGAVFRTTAGDDDRVVLDDGTLLAEGCRTAG